MTDQQASRIERLLKFHAMQLHNITLELSALSLLIAPTTDDPRAQADYVASEKKRGAERKDMLVAFLTKLSEEAAAEHQKADDPELAAALDKLKN